MDKCQLEEVVVHLKMVDRLDRRQGRREKVEERDSEYRSLSPRGRLRQTSSRPDSSLQTLSSQIAFGR